MGMAVLVWHCGEVVWYTAGSRTSFCEERRRLHSIYYIRPQTGVKQVSTQLYSNQTHNEAIVLQSYPPEQS